MSTCDRETLQDQIEQLQVISGSDESDPSKNEPISRNSESSFSPSLEIQIRRFLILGTTGGICNLNEKSLDFENFSIFKEAIESGQGAVLLKQVLEIFKHHLAPRHDTVLYGLAYCSRSRDVVGVEKMKFDSEDVKKVFLDYLKKLQYAALNNLEMIRSVTDLLAFVSYYSKIGEKLGKGRGWGRMMRSMIEKWFHLQAPTKLIMECTKYRKRHGWSLRDILKLSHTKPPEGDWFLLYDHIFHFIIFNEVDFSKNESSYNPVSKSLKKEKKANYDFDKKVIDENVMKNFVFKKIECHLEIQKLRKSEDVPRACELITEGMLVRENVPTDLLQYPKIWETLLNDMPMKALLRNLGKLSSLDIISGRNPEKEEFVDKVVEQVTSESGLNNSRTHPLSLLISKKAYSKGKSSNGKLKWDVNLRILKALDEGFVKSFTSFATFDFSETSRVFEISKTPRDSGVPKNSEISGASRNPRTSKISEAFTTVRSSETSEPVKKSFCICFDFSNSMEKSKIRGSGISCREAASAMGFVLLKTEEKTEFIFFNKSVESVTLEKNISLYKMENFVFNIPGTKSDCSIPFKWALENKKAFDVFVIFTDSENSSEDLRPFEAVQEYRKQMNLPKTKVVVVGMAANKKTLKNPDDNQMLDIVGFDVSILEIIKNFVSEKI